MIKQRSGRVNTVSTYALNTGETQYAIKARDAYAVFGPREFPTNRPENIYGTGLLIWGIKDKIESSSASSTTSDVWIAVGAVSILNSLAGIYGSIIDDKCLLYLSIILLFISSLAQILVIVVRITLPLKGLEQQKAELQELFDKDDDEMDEFFELEHKFKCCGVNDFNDYEQKFDPSLLGYPPSCCEDQDSICLEPYPIGCHEKVMEAERNDQLLRATIFLCSSFIKFMSAIVIAILTIWGDDLLS